MPGISRKFFVQEDFEDLLRLPGYLITLKSSSDRCMPIEGIMQSCSSQTAYLMFSEVSVDSAMYLLDNVLHVCIKSTMFGLKVLDLLWT